MGFGACFPIGDPHVYGAGVGAVHPGVGGDHPVWHDESGSASVFSLRGVDLHDHGLDLDLSAPDHSQEIPAPETERSRMLHRLRSVGRLTLGTTKQGKP